MVEPFKLRTAADLLAIEAAGLGSFLPAATPYLIIERSAARWPSATAIRYLSRVDRPDSDRVVSYLELLRSIRRAANLFRRLGVGPEDAVAILTPHIPQGQIALWAAELAGRACPINPMLRSDHLVSLLRAAKAKVAVVLGPNGELDVWRNVIEPLRRSGCVRAVLDTDSDETAPESDGNFEALAAREPDDRLAFSRESDPDAIAAYFHTGGTTGAPKLAQHTHRNQAFVGTGAALMYRLDANDVLVNGFPLFHVAGSFVYGLSVLSAGATVLVPTRLGMRNRDFVSSIWRQVERYRITAIGGVPTIVSSLNLVPVNADISSLRVMLSGGSPLPTELADAFERNVGKPVRNIFGMTECAGVVTIEPFDGPRTPGSTGLRLPFTEVCAFRQIKGEAGPGARCAPGETGVLALRGPNVGCGYSDPKMNAGTFESDGWLITGDLGHVNQDGRVFVTGRAKDVIIRGAHNIDPSMVEDAMLQHPDVAVAAAIGQPDAYAGEIPVVFVSLKPGRMADEDSLREFVAPLVAEPAARPKHVWILPDLPLTPIGKIYKPALRSIATKRAMIDTLIRAGLPASAFEIEMHQLKGLIRLKSGDKHDAARAHQALLGMPIEYEMQSAHHGADQEPGR